MLNMGMNKKEIKKHWNYTVSTHLHKASSQKLMFFYLFIFYYSHLDKYLFKSGFP